MVFIGGTMNKNKYKTPRNEFHFYLKRTIRFNIQRTRKKELPRKRKHKRDPLQDL